VRSSCAQRDGISRARVLLSIGHVLSRRVRCCDDGGWQWRRWRDPWKREKSTSASISLRNRHQRFIPAPGINSRLPQPLLSVLLRPSTSTTQTTTGVRGARGYLGNGFSSSAHHGHMHNGRRRNVRSTEWRSGERYVSIDRVHTTRPTAAPMCMFSVRVNTRTREKHEMTFAGGVRGRVFGYSHGIIALQLLPRLIRNMIG
jgi:hypothetical protein